MTMVTAKVNYTPNYSKVSLRVAADSYPEACLLADRLRDWFGGRHQFARALTDVFVGHWTTTAHAHWDFYGCSPRAHIYRNEFGVFEPWRVAAEIKQELTELLGRAVVWRL